MKKILYILGVILFLFVFSSTIYYALASTQENLDREVCDYSNPEANAKCGPGYTAVGDIDYAYTIEDFCGGWPLDTPYATGLVSCGRPLFENGGYYIPESLWVDHFFGKAKISHNGQLSNYAYSADDLVCTPCWAVRGFSCGTANGKTYPGNVYGFGSDTLCTEGIADPPADFPSPGSTAHWTCKGTNGSVECSASAAVETLLPPSTDPVDGSCGSASKNYPDSAIGFGSDSFCSSGTLSLANINFPTPGKPSSWTCYGSNGGSNDGSCRATVGTKYSCQQETTYYGEPHFVCIQNAYGAYADSDCEGKCPGYTCNKTTWQCNLAKDSQYAYNEEGLCVIGCKPHANCVSNVCVEVKDGEIFKYKDMAECKVSDCEIHPYACNDMGVCVWVGNEKGKYLAKDCDKQCKKFYTCNAYGACIQTKNDSSAGKVYEKSDCNQECKPTYGCNSLYLCAPMVGGKYYGDKTCGGKYCQDLRPKNNSGGWEGDDSDGGSGGGNSGGGDDGSGGGGSSTKWVCSTSTGQCSATTSSSGNPDYNDCAGRCQKAETRYSCDSSGECKSVSNGQYTRSDCWGQCTVGNTATKYDCDPISGACITYLNGSYSDSNCSGKCSASKTKYDCNPQTKRCEAYFDGKYTNAACGKGCS